MKGEIPSNADDEAGQTESDSTHNKRKSSDMVATDAVVEGENVSTKKIKLESELEPVKNPISHNNPNIKTENTPGEVTEGEEKRDIKITLPSMSNSKRLCPPSSISPEHVNSAVDQIPGAVDIGDVIKKEEEEMSVEEKCKTSLEESCEDDIKGTAHWIKSINHIKES